MSQQLPKTLSNEFATLGAILINGDVFEQVYAVLGDNPAAFMNQQAAAVYEAMITLHIDGIALDPVTVMTAIPDPMEDKTATFLAMLMDYVPTSSHAEFYARAVWDAYRRRELELAAQTVQTRGSDPSALLKALQALEQGPQTSGVALASIFATKLLAEFRAMKDQPGTFGIPTGYPDLDGLLRGGLQKGELIVLAGRPGDGKTAFALNCAYNAFTAAARTPCLMFSLEMSGASLLERLWSVDTGLNAIRIRQGFLGAEELQKAELSCSNAQHWPLWLNNGNTVTIGQIESEVKTFTQRHETALVIVDYLQLIKVMTRGHSREREVADFSGTLKRLARETNCPILCLSQLNRASEQEKEPYRKLAHLRESGAIEQDADVVMMLGPEERTEKRKNNLTLWVVKHRNGPTGKVRLYFDRERQRMQSLTEAAYDTSSFDEGTEEDDRMF